MPLYDSDKPNIPLSIINESVHTNNADMPARPSRYGRWRAATLLGVYVLFAIHIAHWKIAGKTLAPLELNELMYTLELGIVTAGFIFMAVALVATAIFGRFFCSWGCHILALEDLCEWLLNKIGIRPKPVRSRVLMLVPPSAMIYMFVWPQVLRLMRNEPFPEIKILTDADGWASFVTTDMWRNLPSPTVAIITFLVCGFAIVYILGSRSFCQYGCPYGVLFGLADRIAPGRIIEKGTCDQCGLCTAVCTSHVRVHEEIAEFGMIVDANCLKDLDCVSICPNQALGYGFTRPSLMRSFSNVGRRRLRYDFTLFEDVLMAVVFLATLFIFRGLYDRVPFLMTLGMGGIFAYLAVLGYRIAMSANVRLNQYQLKLKGTVTTQGKWFVASLALLLAISIHSAFIRYHEYQGNRKYDQVAWHLNHESTNPSMELVQTSLKHFQACEKWGLIRSPKLDGKLGSLYSFFSPPTEAVEIFARIVQKEPNNHAARLRYYEVLARCGLNEKARQQLVLLTAMKESTNLGKRASQAD